MLLWVVFLLYRLLETAYIADGQRPPKVFLTFLPNSVALVLFCNYKSWKHISNLTAEILIFKFLQYVVKSLT
jgi:hypothetical protein